MEITTNLILQCDKITKTYQSGETPLTVLNQLSIEIFENEFVAITGESGCGKSTLLHSLGCLDQADTGDIIYKEKSYKQLKQNQQDHLRNHEFGFVFQFHHLLPEFTALENVMMPGMIARRSSSEIKCDAETLLHELSLAERSHHKPSQLSGGEQQRVAVARALINNPSILFMDEPTGNLDPEKSRHLIELTLGIQKQKSLTIVMVTHNHEIAELADRRFELREGKTAPCG